MTTEGNGTHALVLGGGGVTGVAWELGLLTALHRAGVAVQAIDLVVGTSAGSVVGAQLASGTDLENLYAAQLAPVGQSSEIAVEFDMNQFQQMIMDVVKKVGMNPAAIRMGIGQKALAAQTVPEETRLTVIETRLPVKTWPATRLLINAVEAETGEWTVFDRDSGVSLVDAVAASCAVPLVWPPVTVNGRRYVDGGMRSGTNADLAKGYDRVLIIQPLAQPVRTAAIFGSDLQQEQELLEAQGSQVLVISPDERALAAIGPNVLDPARRAASAQAGLEQGATLVDSVRAFWSGA